MPPSSAIPPPFPFWARTPKIEGKGQRKGPDRKLSGNGTGLFGLQDLSEADEPLLPEVPRGLCLVLLLR